MRGDGEAETHTGNSLRTPNPNPELETPMVDSWGHHFHQFPEHTFRYVYTNVNGLAHNHLQDREG